VLPGSALHLFVRHSEDLDGSRSFLSVTLNYGILRSFRLDPQNAALTEVVVPIPPATVKQHNTLVVSVEQFLRPNAGSREIWSSLSARSFLELRYAETPLDLNLGRLPSALLEPHTLSANRLTVLLPRRFDPATLEATALLVANFSRRPPGDRIATHIVRSVQAARDPLLIVGTPAEQPELVSLKERLPLAFASTRGRTVLQRTGAATAGEPEGVVGLTTKPGGDQSPILVVSGDSGAGVLRAARSVLAPGWTASGNFAARHHGATVRHVEKPRMAGLHSTPGPVHAGRPRSGRPEAHRRPQLRADRAAQRHAGRALLRLRPPDGAEAETEPRSRRR